MNSPCLYIRITIHKKSECEEVILFSTNIVSIWILNIDSTKIPDCRQDRKSFTLHLFGLQNGIDDIAMFRASGSPGTQKRHIKDHQGLPGNQRDDECVPFLPEM